MISISKKTKKFFFLFLITNFSILVNADSLQKVSTLNVLLPICEKGETIKENNCENIYYNIKAYNGCYKWEFEDSSFYIKVKNNVEVIMNTNESNNSSSDIKNKTDCFNDIYLKSNSHYFPDIENQVLYLIATDAITNKRFNIRVGFAKIDSIHITKRFDSINVEELVELNLQAFDSKGNMFSSLEGLEFKWSFVNTNSTGNSNSIGNSKLALFSKLTEEKKLCSKYREEIEKRNLTSDIILIKGLNPGKVSIQVELFEYGIVSNATVIKSEIRSVYVVEPFSVFPDNVYLLKNSEFDFTILRNKLPSLEFSDLGVSSNLNSLISYKKEVEGVFNNNSSTTYTSSASLHGTFINQKNLNYSKIFNVKSYENYSWRFIDTTYSEKIDNTNNSDNNTDKSSISAKTCGILETTKPKTQLSSIPYKSLNTTCSQEISITDTRTSELNSQKTKIHIVTPTSIEIGIKKISIFQLTTLKNYFDYSKKSKISNNKGISNDSTDLSFISNDSEFEFKHSWKLVENNVYIIKNFLMIGNNFISLNKNIGFSFVYNVESKLFNEYFIVEFCFGGNEICVVRAVKSNIRNNYEGDESKTSISNANDKKDNVNLILSSTINKKLVSDNNNDNNADTNLNELKSSKNIIIYSEIKITKFNQSKFIIPILRINSSNNNSNSSNKITQELRLLISGGSGFYYIINNDKNSNSSINNIDKDPVIIIKDNVIYSNRLGKTVVRVVDQEIESNIDEVEIEVSEIHNYLFKETKIETYDSFSLEVIGVDSNNERFTNCTSIIGEYEVSDDDKLEEYENDKEDYVIKNMNSVRAVTYSDYSNDFICNRKRFIIKNIKDIKNREIKYETDKPYYSFNAMFSTKIDNVEVISAISARIRIYKELVLNNPISDAFSLLLVKKISHYNISNRNANISLVTGEGLDISFMYGSQPWLDINQETTSSSKYTSYLTITEVANKENDKSKSVSKETYYYNIINPSMNDNTSNLKPIPSKYAVTIEKPNSKNKNTSINTDNNNILNSNPNIINIRCNQIDTSLKLILITHNTKSTELLNPLVTKTELNLRCVMPHYLGVYLPNYINNGDSSNSISNNQSISVNKNLHVFEIPQNKDIEYFIKNNNTEEVRLYAFDENKYMIMNFNSFHYNDYSIVNNFMTMFLSFGVNSNNTSNASSNVIREFISDVILVSSSNVNSINSITNKNSNTNAHDISNKIILNYSIFNTHVSNVIQGISNDSKIKTSITYKNNNYSKKEQTLIADYINSSISNSSSTNNNLINNQACIINIITKPKIEPDSIVIAPWQKRVLSIKNGSGYFTLNYEIIDINNKTIYDSKNIINNSVNTNTSLPIVSIIKNNKTGKDITAFISITPNSEFNYTPVKIIISIVDIYYNHEFNTSSVVYISPIKSISLLGGGLLMQENTKTASIIAMSYFDSYFSSDIFSEKENYYKSLSSSNSNTQNTKDIFNLRFKHLHNKNDIEIIEFNYNTNSLKLNDNKVDNNSNNSIFSTFTVKGHTPSTYNLSIVFSINNNIISSNTSTNNNNNIAYLHQLESNHITFEVFTKIKINPSYLLMIPGSSFAIQISKGPNNPNIEKQFYIKDINTANIEKDSSIVHAFNIGKTELTVTLIDKNENSNNFFNKSLNNINDNSVLCSETIIIEVAFPDKAEILSGSERKLFTDSSIRLITVLKTPDNRVFTFGVGYVYYEWSTNQPLVAKLKTKFDGNKRCSDSSNNSINNNSNDYNDSLYTNNNDSSSCALFSGDNIVPVGNNIGVFVTSIGKGEAIVTCKVVIDYPSEFKNYKRKEFTSSIKLLVDDNLWISISEFYDRNKNKSSLYLLPYNISHDLKTNRNESNIIFKSLDTNNNFNNNLYSLSPQGRITTNSIQGIAQIIADQNNKAGISISNSNINNNSNSNTPFIPTILSVFITNFHSLFVEKSYQLLNIDIGQTQELKIILQHEFGLLFADNIESPNIEILSSHPKIATTFLTENNNKLKIKALLKGKTNIIVFDSQSQKIYDVFMVEVHASLVMNSVFNINVGGSIELLSKEKDRRSSIMVNSEWVSTDLTVFYVNSNSGIGVGVKEGTVKLLLIENGSQRVKLSAVVNVLSIKNVGIDDNYGIGGIGGVKDSTESASFSLPVSYLTNIREDRNFRVKYFVKLNFYLNSNSSNLRNSLSLNNKDNLNIIKQNIKFKCESDNDLLYKTEAYTDLEDTSFCVISLNTNPDYSINSPPTLDISVVVLSNDSSSSSINSSNSISSIIKLPYYGVFKLNKYFISLDNKTKSNLSTEIELNTSFKEIDYYIKEIDVNDDRENKDNKEDYDISNSSNASNNKLPVSSIVNYISDLHSSVKVSVYDSINSSFSFKIIFVHKITKQTEECIVTYTYNSRKKDNNEEDDMFKTKSDKESIGDSILSNSTLTDLITVIIILCSLFVVLRYYITNSNKNSFNANYSNIQYPNSSGNNINQTPGNYNSNYINNNSNMKFNSNFNNPYSNNIYSSPYTRNVNNMNYDMSSAKMNRFNPTATNN